MKTFSKEFVNSQIVEYQLANLQQLVFEVTDACNLKCKYCGYGEYYNDYDKRENSNLPKTSALALIDYLNDYWNSTINYSINKNTYISFYGGEPLLNMNFVENIVEYINGLDSPNKNFSFSMTTNAVLLNRYMKYLVENDFRLLISLDGNEYNHSYRVDHSGNNSFNNVFSNVKKLQETYPDYFKNRVNFNAVLHNRNGVSEVIEFIQKEFNKIARIGELNTDGINPDMEEIFRKTYNNKRESLSKTVDLKEFKKKLFINDPDTSSLSTYIHQLSGNVFNSYNDFFAKKAYSDNTIPTATCLPFAKKLFVTVNGKIMTCERIGQQFSLGKVEDDAVEIDTERIAELYNSWYSKIKKQCDSCYGKDICSRCIFTIKGIEYKPVCEDFLNEKQLNKYINHHMNYLRENPELYRRIMDEILIM